MRYQKITYSCGAAAAVNAIRCFGKKIPERRIRAWAETDKSGTGDEGIVQALECFGYKGEIFDLEDRDLAVQRLIGAVTIVCIQESQHWATVVGTTDGGDRFIIVDSANTKRNMSENGVHILSRKELLKTWQTRKGKLSGITVVRPKRNEK